VDNDDSRHREYIKLFIEGKDEELSKLQGGKLYKMTWDDRVTLVGKFLRRTSLDEVPQLINVLRGEMSIVGRRADYPFEIRDQAAKYNVSQEVIEKILLSKPGITGPWQVSGRSLISFDKRVQIDADYASKKSIVYDLMIIFKTPYVVLSMKGAY